MTAGAACTVCASPRRAEVDADLSDPVLSGYTRTAAAYGLRKDAVRRHKLNGHVRPQAPSPPARNSAPPPPPPGSGEEPEPDARDLTAVQVLEKLLRTMNATATDDMSPRELNVHRDTQRRVAVDLAKYQVAIDREGPAERELRALEGMMIAGDEALEAFPDARAAVALAVKRWKALREAPEAAE